jgi:hypothetical protein
MERPIGASEVSHGKLCREATTARATANDAIRDATLVDVGGRLTD